MPRTYKPKPINPTDLIKIEIPVSLINNNTLRSTLNTLQADRKETTKKGKPITKVTNTTFYHNLYIIGYIRKQQLLGKLSPDTYIPIHARTLSSNLNGSYHHRIDELKALGIIQALTDKNGVEVYSVTDNESKQYRLTENYRNDSYMVTDCVIKKLEDKKKKVSDKRTKILVETVSTNQYAHLKNATLKLVFDCESAIKDVNHWFDNQILVKGQPFTEKRKISYLSFISKQEHGSRYFTCHHNGRLGTDIGSCPKAIRNRYSIDGYDGGIIQADIKSSQVLMAIPALRAYQAGLTGKDTSDIDRFINMIASGEFYYLLSQNIKNKGVKEIPIVNEANKQQLKDLFFKRVWYKNESKKNTFQYRQIFNELYPNINDFILEHKVDVVVAGELIEGNSVFANKLTKVESQLVNDVISKRVFDELGAETCFFVNCDAMMFKEADADVIIPIITEVIKTFTGLDNMVDITTLSKESKKSIGLKTPISINAHGKITENIEVFKYATPPNEEVELNEFAYLNITLPESALTEIAEAESRDREKPTPLIIDVLTKFKKQEEEIKAKNSTQEIKSGNENKNEQLGVEEYGFDYYGENEDANISETIKLSPYHYVDDLPF